ncbi:MAG: aspartate--tRNA ligase, partial [Francisellaceae bacterium]|nr:aspartate--tRNA ligase [Francisellaceae bacterium]
MTQIYRTHTCGALTQENIGEKILVSGWVHYRRDFGGLIFLEIRDHTGLIQVVFDPSVNAEVFAIAEKARKEYVVRINGDLRIRPNDTANPNMPTGTIEIVADSFEIISKTVPLPFYPDDHQTISEEVRLKYRVLDLRREEMAKNIRLRSKITGLLRNFL